MSIFFSILIIFTEKISTIRFGIRKALEVIKKVWHLTKTRRVFANQTRKKYAEVKRIAWRKEWKKEVKELLMV